MKALPKMKRETLVPSGFFDSSVESAVTPVVTFLSRIQEQCHGTAVLMRLAAHRKNISVEADAKVQRQRR